MDTLKQLIVTVIVSALVALGVGLAITHTPSGGKLGGVDPNIPSLYLKWGGEEVWQQTVQIAATSSVFAAIQNPAAATTTIDHASCYISANGIAQNQTFDISTSSTAYSSSSPALIKAGTILASATRAITWDGGPASTTASGVLGSAINNTGDSPFWLAPSEWITFRLASGTPGTYASYYTGSCTFSGHLLGR